MTEPTSWPVLLPNFAAHLSAAAERARDMKLDEPALRLSIEMARLGDADYRTSLVGEARAWRGARDRSTIYVFSSEAPIPQDLINMLRNGANEALRDIGQRRGFAKCNAREAGVCLYVGHSRTIEVRLRDHLGFGAAGTSSLQLSHWDGHPFETLTFTAYRLAVADDLLAQLLEEYLWDELAPLLGKRGGK